MTDVNGSADAGNPGGNGAPPEWLGKLDEGARGVLTTKGWADPDPAVALGKVLGGYSGLEKLLGHDRAGRTVVLPGEKATPDEIRAFHSKIGVPETPDAYKFEVGEGADENLLAWARSAFHKAGVPASAAATVVREWEGFAQAAQKRAAEAEAAEKIKAFEEWKASHGPKYEEHVESARKAMKALGINPPEAEQIDDLFKGLGLSGLGGVDLLARLANDYKIGVEGDLIEGRNNGIGASPEAAKAALAEFERSEEWLSVAFNKHAPGRDVVLAKRQKLYEAAYPDAGDGITVIGRVS